MPRTGRPPIHPVVGGNKVCRKCGRNLPVGEFRRPSDRKGPRTVCRRCETIFYGERAKYIKGVDILALLEQGCCLCGRNENLVIDHDHTTETFRGVLCNKHNVALGLFGDDPDMLLKAWGYLSGR